MCSYFQQFSLPKARKTRLQADFVTNNQILVVKIIKIRLPLLFRPPPHLLDFMNFSDSPFIKTPPLLSVYSGPKTNTSLPKIDRKQKAPNGSLKHLTVPICIIIISNGYLEILNFMAHMFCCMIVQYFHSLEA